MIKEYNKIGINHFKVTGRTGGTKYLTKVVEAYLSERWDGNLLELWKQLQSIYDGKKDSDNDYIKDYLDSSKLDDFIKRWSEGNFICSNEDCGSTCKYCQEFYENKLKGTN